MSVRSARRFGPTAAAVCLAALAVSILLGVASPARAQEGVRLLDQAWSLSQQGRFEDAEAVLTRARRVAERDSNAAFALTLVDTDLALMRRQQGRMDEAEMLLRRVIDSLTDQFGPDAVELATPLTNLGSLLSGTGRSDRAAPLYRRAMEIRRAARAPENEDSLRTETWIVRDLVADGRLVEADERLATLRPRAEALLGADNAVSVETLRLAGYVSGLLGRPDEAAVVLEAAFGEAAQAHGEESFEVYAILHSWARVRYDAGDYDGSALLLRQMVRITEQDPLSWPRAAIQARGDLGEVLMADGKPIEALMTFRRASAMALERRDAAPGGPGEAIDVFGRLVGAAWDVAAQQ